VRPSNKGATLPLFDLMPKRCVEDFLKIAEEYANDL